MSRPTSQQGAVRRATLELARADIGFSAGHFSIIDGHPERLHGHNYRVSVRARGDIDNHGTVLDFHALKDALRAVCHELDEHMLVPVQSTEMSVVNDDASVSVEVASRRYVFPREDVCLLPVVNSTCECLAAYLLTALRRRLGDIDVHLEVGVEELPGQGAVIEE